MGWRGRSRRGVVSLPCRVSPPTGIRFMGEDIHLRPVKRTTRRLESQDRARLNGLRTTEGGLCTGAEREALFGWSPRRSHGRADLGESRREEQLAVLQRSLSLRGHGVNHVSMSWLVSERRQHAESLCPGPLAPGPCLCGSPPRISLEWRFTNIVAKSGV